MSDMILTNLVTLGQIMECPFTGEIWKATEKDVELALKREQVRLRLVKELSSAPLYQARAAKDPEYWNTLYLGVVH